MRTKKAFKVKQKAFFVIFKGRSIAKNCLRPDSAPFRPSKNLLRHEKAKQKQKFKFFFSPRQRSGREEIKNCLKNIGQQLSLWWLEISEMDTLIGIKTLFRFYYLSFSAIQSLKSFVNCVIFAFMRLSFLLSRFEM